MRMQKIRTALNRFGRSGFLTDETTPDNQLITIVKWSFYQGETENTTGSSTDGQQTVNRRLTANKNIRMRRMKRKIFVVNAFTTSTLFFYQLALEHLEAIKQNNPNAKEPNVQKWANDFGLRLNCHCFSI